MRLDILHSLNTERAARRAAIVVTDIASGAQRFVAAADVAGDPLREVLEAHLRSGKSGMEERSSRQGRSLAGCKSPYRQLPVVGRLAYPMRGEVTNRVLLGRKSPGCPAGVFAAVGTIWGASKLGGRNITKYLQPRKSPRMKSFQAG